MAAAGACFRARLAREPSTAGDRTARGLAGYRRTWPPSFDGRGRGVLPGTHRLGAPSAAAEGRRERSGRRTWPPCPRYLPSRAGGRVQPSRSRARPARRPNRAGAGQSTRRYPIQRRPRRRPRARQPRGKRLRRARDQARASPSRQRAPTALHQPRDLAELRTRGLLREFDEYRLRPSGTSSYSAWRPSAPASARHGRPRTTPRSSR